MIEFSWKPDRKGPPRGCWVAFALDLVKTESGTRQQAENCVFINPLTRVFICAAFHAVHFARHIRNCYPS